MSATFTTSSTNINASSTVSDQSHIDDDGRITIKLSRKIVDADGTRHYIHDDIRMTAEQWSAVAGIVDALINAPKDMDGWAFMHNLERKEVA